MKERRTKSPAVARVGQPHHLYSKASVRLSVEEKSDFLAWLQSHTRYDDAVMSNATINLWIQYGNSAHVSDGCRQQIYIQNCGQTAADKDIVTIDSL